MMSTLGSYMYDTHTPVHAFVHQSSIPEVACGHQTPQPRPDASASDLDGGGGDGRRVKLRDEDRARPLRDLEPVLIVDVDALDELDALWQQLVLLAVLVGPERALAGAWARVLDAGFEVGLEAALPHVELSRRGACAFGRMRGHARSVVESFGDKWVCAPRG